MWYGRGIKSKEGERLIQGKGEFLANMHRDGMLHAAFVRSPYAHARIEAINAEAALRRPGVVAVITGQEVAKNTEPILQGSELLRLSRPEVSQLVLPVFYALSHDEVNFVGDPVAVVVAESSYIAEDALDDVEVEYEPLPAVTDAEEALKGTSPKTFSDWGTNIGCRVNVTHGDINGAFASAAHVVRRRFSFHRSGYPPLEPLRTIAEWNDRDGLTVWATAQRVHVGRVAFSDILRIPAGMVRVIAPRDIGGGFGWKGALYREPFAVAYAAKVLGRPVAWIQDRLEALKCGVHERECTAELEGAFNKDGKLLGLRGRFIHDVGCAKVDQHYYSGALVGIWLPSPYEIEAQQLELLCVVTNKAPRGINRPAGRMPRDFAYERFLDLAARELGMDGAAIRRKNLVRSLPYKTPQGMVIEGDFAGAFEKLLEKAGYPALREDLEHMRGEGRHVGFGVSTNLELASPVGSGGRSSGQPSYASARVRIETDGGVVVFAGDSPQGQSRETTVAQIVADQFGVDPYAVQVVFGDTAVTPFNNHAAATQTAAHLAAKALREKVLKIGAYLLESAEHSNFDMRDGCVVHKDNPHIKVELRQIARAAYLNAGALLPLGLTPTLEETVFHQVRETTNGFSTQAGLVEVFPETGEFKILKWWYVGDAGQAMNPLLLEGAIHGGICAGIADTAYEQYAYDENGQFLSGTLMDYIMPGPNEMPPMEVHEHNTPCKTSVLGFKRVVTEGVPSGVPPALCEAVDDALRPLSIEFVDLPLTPSRLWHAVNEAQLRGGRRSTQSQSPPGRRQTTRRSRDREKRGT